MVKYHPPRGAYAGWLPGERPGQRWRVVWRYDVHACPYCLEVRGIARKPAAFYEIAIKSKGRWLVRSHPWRGAIPDGVVRLPKPVKACECPRSQVDGP